MYPLLFLAAFFAITGFYQVTLQRELPPVVATVSAKETAQNMVVYYNKVAAYVGTKAAGYTEPSAGNTVPDASLALPTWYVRNSLWTNKVINGVVTVYATAAPQAGNIASALVSASGAISGTGVTSTSSGTIINPVFGNTGVTFPAGLPNGVPIIQARIK